MLGSTHHTPNALFKKVTKKHFGRSLGFIQPSECQMAGHELNLLCLYCLQAPTLEVIMKKTFLDMFTAFHAPTHVLEKPEFWHFLYAVVQALYPMFCILRLVDMKIGGMDKLKFYVMQADKLLPFYMENVKDQWDSLVTPEVVKTLVGVKNLFPSLKSAKKSTLTKTVTVMMMSLAMSLIVSLIPSIFIMFMITISQCCLLCR